jgi:hypothetical protein
MGPTRATAAGQHSTLLFLANEHAAGLAAVCGRLRLVVVPPKLPPDESLHHFAVGAWDEVVPLVAFQKRLFDRRHETVPYLDRAQSRRGNTTRLSIPKVCRALVAQVPRVALGAADVFQRSSSSPNTPVALTGDPPGALAPTSVVAADELLNQNVLPEPRERDRTTPCSTGVRG